MVRRHLEKRTPTIMGHLHARRSGTQTSKKIKKIDEEEEDDDDEEEDLLEKENNNLPKAEPGVLRTRN